jgi:oxepin-CoA hydrolase/3-oxo-5,6-dehydrosuberyl-CoA semialdehyde dehydrogenase
MTIIELNSFACGAWMPPSGELASIRSAVTGDEIAVAGTADLDFADMLAFAKEKGGTSLGELTFHDRAKMLKALALHLQKNIKDLYTLSYETGATLGDSKIDIDGGIGTMLVYASKGRREMPDEKIFIDGEIEMLSRKGTFLGQHVLTPLKGVAVHINAFNFPVWGMLEKLAPTLLAGVPAIVKPATATSYLTEACFRIIIESGILPEGAVQLVTGSTGNLLDLLGCQDVVGFTGSADTALMLRSRPNLLENAVRFVAEQDSLNASVLGLDAAAGTPEFDLFIKEAVTEITTKAGQKCTATRRLLIPRGQIDAVADALKTGLAEVVIGHPAEKSTQMGALASQAQRDDVRAKAEILSRECEMIFGDGDFTAQGADRDKGAFMQPILFHCADPRAAQKAHQTEAFGPVATLMPYDGVDDAIDLLNRGGGSLVASVITHDQSFARDIVLGSGAYHGRLYFNNRDSAGESTGHGSPLPHMVHGGPGRAGGGEEMGGIRGVMHYMQRTAIQGSPDILTAVSGFWTKGARQITKDSHPFRHNFNILEIGESITRGPRVITMDDIEHFAHFTGDTFYAHMDEKAAKANPFFPDRVAHGYLLLSFAAGLFVEPNPGPVLANTGINSLGFEAPVVAGDSLSVTLTVKRKTKRTEEYGQVRWHVHLFNQNDETVGEYELLTMVSYG